MLVTPWRPHGLMPPDAHLFAIGDIHGQADVLEDLLEHLRALPRGPGQAATAAREIIFLGDLIDRGPDSLGAVRLAWEAEGFDQRTILPGNHELMMLDTLDTPEDWDLWLCNGGFALLQELDPDETMNLPEALAALRAKLPRGFETVLRQGHTILRRGDFLFVHAGIAPDRPLIETAGLERLRSTDDFSTRMRHWAWIRDPFLERDTAKPWPDAIGCVVHGHTMATQKPIDDLDEILPNIDLLSNQGRICLDVGAAAVPQAAALEISGDVYRIHILPAPGWGAYP